MNLVTWEASPKRCDTQMELRMNDMLDQADGVRRQHSDADGGRHDDSRPGIGRVAALRAQCGGGDDAGESGDADRAHCGVALTPAHTVPTGGGDHPYPARKRQ